MMRPVMVFMVLFFSFGCQPDDGGPEGRVGKIVEIDCSILEEALDGYAPVPTGQVAAAVILAVEAIRADRLVVTLENYLKQNELETEVKLFTDSRVLESKTVTLPAGSEQHVYVDLPVTVLDEREITVSILPSRPENLAESDAGLRFLKREFVFRSGEYSKIHKVDFAGDIDGDLSEWEGVPFSFLDAGEAGDISARLFLGWDDKYFYISASVCDDKHFNTKAGAGIWNGDALQFAFDVPGDVEAFNMGLALASGSVQAHKWHGSETGLLENSEYIVVRDDNSRKTYYEARLPFEHLKIEPAMGSIFGFGAVVFDDDDGKGQEYWVETSPGIAGGWNPSELSRFVLWD